MSFPRQVIFVFGSNLAGRHGAGAALEAHQKWQASYGVGVGRTGQSYAIPTKDENLKVLPTTEIEKHVKEFIAYARANPQLVFLVTAVGCGLAGYRNSEMAPMFFGAPVNCVLPLPWRELRQKWLSKVAL